MANISPFHAIRPNSLYADQLVFTTMQAESVSGDLSKTKALLPLKTLLESGARQRPETAKGQALAYQEINDTFQNLLDTDRLWREKKPGIYVYEVAHKSYKQTGIWTRTALADYKNGNIKTHELTFKDSVRRLKNYWESTGLEGSPVLLTYPPDIHINRVIAETKATGKKTTFGNREAFHRLWKIEDEETIQKLVDAFAKIGTVYLADGHHRLASGAQTSFDTISSLYLSTDQLRIEEYDRVILTESPVDKKVLLARIMQDFHVREAKGNRPIQPKEIHNMGMYVAKKWYHLMPKEATETELGASILQEQLLKPVFDINDPATDQRLKCIGGEKAIEELQAFLENHPSAIAFTLCPLSVQQIMNVADAGEILPPKSTWIDPKVPYGLLINKHYQ